MFSIPLYNRYCIRLSSTYSYVAHGMRMTRLIHVWVVCRKTLPHDICIFMCRYREMYYYFILTAAWTLIILTMLATFCLFLIISRSKLCFNVHLPSWSQFSFSFTPMRLCLYSSNTSPLWICLFYHTCMPQCHMFIFSRFFYRRIFSKVCCIHEVLVAFPYRRDLQYLNNIPDHAQYPVKRCDKGAYMYHRQTSQGSEVMNVANINIRVKGSVCPVNAAMLTIIEQVGRLCTTWRDDSWDNRICHYPSSAQLAYSSQHSVEHNVYASLSNGA